MDLNEFSDVENGYLLRGYERRHITKSERHPTVVVNVTGTFGAKVEFGFIASECCKPMWRCLRRWATARTFSLLDHGP